jgi:signal transduction histidine kinase
LRESLILVEENKITGLKGKATSRFARVTSEFTWTEDDEDALRVLKLGGAVGIFMLLAYLMYDQYALGRNAPGTGLHWLAVALICGFFGLAWTRAFRRFWKFWVLLFNLILITMFFLISLKTGDPESRFIAAMLCPLATASFVSWGTGWQFAMAALSMTGYAVGNRLVPINSPDEMYRWLGLTAAMVFAQYTSVFIERYRRRLRGQVADLEEAARFRETQIATMAHDVRSPVAALSGYVSLLEDDGINSQERTDLLGRIGSTAWNMDLVVSNVLDYYDVQDEAIIAEPVETDPNQILSDVTEDCALQARRRRLSLRVELTPIPECKLDRRHFDRIVRNLLAYAFGRTMSGEVFLRAGVRNDAILIEVTDSGPSLSQTQQHALFQRPNRNGDRGAARGIGLYVARAMVEAAGGRTEARCPEGRQGLTLLAEIPLVAQPSKARAS